MTARQLLVMSLVALAAPGCAATLESQTKDRFSETYRCPAESITVTATSIPAHELLLPQRDWRQREAAMVDAEYTVASASGCGRSEVYACGADWTFGCIRRGESPFTVTASWARETPGTTFPPTLVDQVPPPPPPPVAAGD